MNPYGTRLGAITKELWHEWQRAKESWRDGKSQEFQQKYIEELLGSVDKTVAVIEQIDKIMHKIRKDCE
jgi:phospholipase C